MVLEKRCADLHIEDVSALLGLAFPYYIANSYFRTRLGARADGKRVFIGKTDTQR